MENKIIVLDGYRENPGDLSWEGLEALGELTVYDRTPNELAAGRIGDANIVYTNKTPITRATMETCPSIRFIGVLATGYNVVDVEAAKERGIPVTNIPTYGSNSVSQFAIALLLEICHHIGHHSKAVAEGRWETNPDWCFWDYPLIELADKTMGIIGMGRIGLLTGRIAKALGMKIVAYDEYPTESGREVAEYVFLDKLFETSDVISLHCPLFPSTEGIVSKTSIAKMKDGVIIVNTARGPIVSLNDITDALNSGKIKAAGLDVLDVEPDVPMGHAIFSCENAVLTPHCAYNSAEAVIDQHKKVAKTVIDVLDGNLPYNCVNKKDLRR